MARAQRPVSGRGESTDPTPPTAPRQAAPREAAVGHAAAGQAERADGAAPNGPDTLATPATSRGVAGPGNRRDEILAIAAAIFARKGVANTTVRDIAKEAGMLSGSLYHYFASKEEMLDEIIRTALDADIAQDEALASSDHLEPQAAVRELFHRGLMFAHDHPDVSAIVCDSSKEFVGTAAYELVRRRDRAIRQAWTRVLERGVEVGAFRADLDVELAFRAMIAVVIQSSRWYRPSGPHPMEDIAATMAKLFLEGFCSTPTA